MTDETPPRERATEPRTEAGRRLHLSLDEAEECVADGPGLYCGNAESIAAIEAEAAQGAAPLPDWPKCLTIGCDRIAGPAGGRCAEHHASEGAAPRAEELDVARLAQAAEAVEQQFAWAPRRVSVATFSWAEYAEKLAAAYVLSRPSDEESDTARSRCKRFRHDEHCIGLDHE